jgi:hypothetical protein
MKSEDGSFQPAEDDGEEADRKVEVELALYPGSLGYHYTIFFEHELNELHEFNLLRPQSLCS